MTTCTRNGKRWNINEVLSLEREFELLELSIPEIALRHKRTERAILCKLFSEGWISEDELELEVEESEYNNIDDNSVDSDENDINSVDSDGNSDDTNNVNYLTSLEIMNNRIYNLECAVEEISHVVEKISKVLVSSKKTNKIYM